MTRKKLLILTLSFCLLDTLAPLAATPEIRILQRRAAQDAAVVLPADASTILRYTVSDFNEDCRESPADDCPSSQRSGKRVRVRSYCLPSSGKARCSTG